MRVLLLGFQWSRGGGLEAVTVEIALALRALGAEVEVWAAAQPGAPEADGITARGLAPAGRLARSLDARFLWRPRLAREVGREAARFDLVVCAHPWLLPPVRHALEGRVRRPAIWAWAHGIEVWGEAGRRIASDLAWADRVVAVSRFTRREVEPWTRAARLSVVHNPVDTVRYAPGPAEEQGAPELLIVGRLAAAERYKGHEVLFKALRQLEHRTAAAVRLRVVGHGDLRPSLEREAERLGVARRVEFAGRLSAPALVDAYRACRVFVMPSRVERRARGLWGGEGLGIVYLEAQACGRPVVASTEGGAPDTVVPGTTGLLADPRDPAAVADAVADLLADPAAAEARGRAARAWTVERFSRDVYRARLAELLASPRPEARSSAPLVRSPHVQR